MKQPSRIPRRSSPSRSRVPVRILGFSEADERLRDIFFNHGFGDITHAQRHQLVRYYELLMQGNREVNMTRLLNFRDVAIKHFIDCLIVPRLTQIEFPLMDVGTGAGFPGIPLAILYPDQPIWLAEGVLRRVEFLKRVREALDLRNVEIIGRNIGPDFVRPARSVITRALAASRETLHMLRGCLGPGGRAYLMKGPHVDHELKALKSVDDFRLHQDIAYRLPKTPHERRLVVFERVAT
jgi:16S rRNA (guanine527-N7)-methyltransferase